MYGPVPQRQYGVARQSRFRSVRHTLRGKSGSGHCSTGHQSPAAHGSKYEIESFYVFVQFHGGRSLSVHDVPVVVRVKSGHAFFKDYFFQCGFARLLCRFAFYHLCTVTAYSVLFNLRRVLRHYDTCRHA